METYWNGELTPARRVVVIVGPTCLPSWWCASLAGERRDAVEVTYGDAVEFLDDEDGSGWYKVTDGRGSPRAGHRSLPDDSVVLYERTG